MCDERQIPVDVSKLGDNRQMPSTPYLLFRAYCESDSTKKARSIASFLCDRLACLGMTKIERVEPYWKMPELYHLSLCVDVAEDHRAVMAQVRKLFQVE